MKAKAIVQRRVVLAEDAFVEIAIWLLPTPVPPSLHPYKYRLAYVVADECVLRYDNERGKGDHRHLGMMESPYRFFSIDQLLADFQNDVERWNDEYRRP
jgi:hypothetical protein